MTDVVHLADNVTLYYGDCLEILPTLADGVFDAVVTDPPYGIGADVGQCNRANKQHGAAALPSRDYGESDWDFAPPLPEAFAEMRRVSVEQVIFGANHFADRLPASSSWIVWDKDNGANGYADCELAWISHKRAVRKFRWRWQGMLQEPGGPKDARVHPTQKPVELMVWVVGNYTPEGASVLDPYLGSGTTGVACARLGRAFTGIEIERRYFDIACKRIEKELSQGKLF